MELPQPKLGEITAITIASPNLEASLKFYQILGFTEVMRFDFPFPWIQISDGALLIMLRLDKKEYIALTYYVKNIDKITTELEQVGIKFSQKPQANDLVKRFVFESPDGLTISLVSIIDGFAQPPGPTMLTMPQSDMFNPEKYVNKICGMYGEFAHRVNDLNVSVSYWEKLGFKALTKFESPYPWAILSDGLAVVGLHQTKNFINPAITYFASDMKDKINKLKNEGLNNFEEKMGAGNITLTTPENQRINLFSMGM